MISCPPCGGGQCSRFPWAPPRWWQRVNCFAQRDESDGNQLHLAHALSEGEMTCLVCLSTMGCGLDGYLKRKRALRLRCQHTVCADCLAWNVNQAAGDRAQFSLGGLKCPTGSHTCTELILYDDLRKLQKIQSNCWPWLLNERCISQYSLDQMARFISEAGIQATGENVVSCPTCEAIYLYEAIGHSHVQCCQQCQTRFCANCGLCEHDQVTCDEAASDLRSSEFIKITSKACPNKKCEAPITHWHGHGCHHIRPAISSSEPGGCHKCHTNFCYVCNATEHENVSQRGRRDLCLCRPPHGTWTTFCKEADIKQHLKMHPYPHDSRCGCRICPECRPGTKCAACDGTCVVCRGIVDPGPPELPSTLQELPSTSRDPPVAPGSSSSNAGSSQELPSTSQELPSTSQDPVPPRSSRTHTGRARLAVRAAFRTLTNPNATSPSPRSRPWTIRFTNRS